MTKAKLKAIEMVDEYGISEAKIKCKQLLEVSHYNEYAGSFQYWGDVMDELNEMERWLEKQIELAIFRKTFNK